ncbi:Micrococcal nuclease [Halomicronema hongdechloris C2206]|uniref:Micrococcal nuclease n=1 Tax=Halomicronema hongdechloris C2206 TaxID=1641165 RepID=A0A1Z3HNJ0_9CYAN|nr:thermonuclease family protein [Halomicronema hongdechloris]ASC71859.1 Micrococcal nuclease [Halomicronema hongdechloris C2206]
MALPRHSFHLNVIKDGDTLIASGNNITESVRLYGIDCPELAQAPYGEAARQRIQKLLEPYDTIEVIEVDRDRHGRLVGEVWVEDGCINTQLLAEGHAVAYGRHLKGEFRDRYVQAEAIARKARLNFWQQPRPEMPWDYRQRHPH